MRKLTHSVSCVHRSACNLFLAFIFLAFASNLNAQCKGQINVSLDADCIAKITPAMIQKGVPDSCLTNATISLIDPWGDPLPTDTVDFSMVGWTIQVELFSPDCQISCWGYALIEDKFSPQVFCKNDTVMCHQLNTVGLPMVVENCHGNPGPTLLDEVITAMPCDTFYTSMIVRTYTATDDGGNQGDTCEQKILIERPDLTGVTFPMDTIIYDDFVCINTKPMTDEGLPAPSVTGVPMLNGGALFPIVPPYLCNTTVDYDDHIIIKNACKTKFVRTWKIVEWWCDRDSMIIFPQQITINDTIAPIVTCAADILPPDYVAITGQDCMAEYIVDPPALILECNKDYWDVGFLSSPDGTCDPPPPGSAFNFIDVTPYTDPDTGLETYKIEGLPSGCTWLRYRVFDQCGNVGYCGREINIIDGSDPIAICQNSEVVSLNSDGKAWLCAESIDKGSYDACGPVTIEVARMNDNCGLPENLIFGDCVEFCCADLPIADGPQTQMVIMKVTDAGGRMNTCMVEVQVQDKLNPIFIAPPKDTIDCDVDYDLTQLSDDYGEPIMVGADNCPENISIVETPTDNINDCGEGRITRRWVVTNPDGSSYNLQQIICVVNPMKFDSTGIAWPPNRDFTTICPDTLALHPDNLPDNLSPVISGDDECSLVGKTYTDQVFFGNPNQPETCLKILRKWVVIDWCQKVNGKHVRWERTQTLKVINSVAPEIAPLGNITVETTDADCAEEEVPLTATATDDCTSQENLVWSYIIDFNNDGSPDDFGLTNSITNTYPLGTHSIEWTVTDACGNFDTATQLFTVTNTKKPVPVCLSDLVVELSNGSALIWAEELNASSYSPCNYEIFYSFSADQHDTSLEFVCADIGTQPIELWVTDENGNQAYCNAMIHVQDNDMDCGTLLNGNVLGRVTTVKDDDIADVQVYLDGSNSMEMTDNAGSYDFGTMPTGGEYMLVPKKIDDYLNGVSTVDLIQIQRHLLGIEVLDSPYKILAADINNSQSVTGIDIVELRKLILGIYTELPNNDSWRFITHAHNFLDLEDPWSGSIPSEYHIDNLYGTYNIPFIGVKIGDVNQNATTNLNNIVAENRSGSVTLEVDRIASQEEDKFLHAVFLKDVTELIGIQAAISLIGNESKIVGLKSGQIEIQSNNYNLNSSDGTVALSWNSIEREEAIEEDIALFYIVTEGKGSNEFELQNDRLDGELYAENGIKALIIENRNIQLDVEKTIMMQNMPNPWSESTIVQYALPYDSPVELNVYDLQGRLVFRQKVQQDAGTHSFTINKSDIEGIGIYTYEIRTNKESLKNKMIIVD